MRLEGRAPHAHLPAVDGRDHHPRNFCMWVAAGGGTTRGAVLGEMDDFSDDVVSDPVSVHDLQATILHLMASITRG